MYNDFERSVCLFLRSIIDIENKPFCYHGLIIVSAMFVDLVVRDLLTSFDILEF